MELYRKIEELNNLCLEANNALEEAKGLLTQQRANTLLNSSFESLKQECLERLKQSFDSFLENKSQEIESLATNTINALFSQNLESLATQIASRIDLNKVVELTTNRLKKQNDNKLIESLRVIIGSEEFQEFLQRQKNNIQQSVEAFQSILDSFNMESRISNHAQRFLETNKDEILTSADLGFLKEGILANEELRDTLALNAKEAIKEIIGKEDIKNSLIEVLKQDAKAVFEESSSLQELQERRFLSATLLLNMCLQGEIKFITQSQEVINHLKIEKKRAESLENIDKRDVVFKNYAVI